MPVSFLSNEQRESYGRYTGAPSPDDLARYFHLDDSDHALIAQKRGAHNRLGFAVQLGTLRYLGTFLESPLAVPAPVLHTLAKQLRIAAIPDAHLYSASRQRLQHAAEIQTHYGYVEITERQIGFHLTRWLYALCWTGTDRPTVLFERAVTWLVTHKVLLPGSSTLERYIARLRSRVEERLWHALGRGISSEQQGRLESLLLVPVGSRSSLLDHLEAVHNQSHVVNWGMRKRYPSDISKEAFEEIRPLLESVRKQTKPRTVDLYEVFCGVLYLLKSGCQWRMLPSAVSEMANGACVLRQVERTWSRRFQRPGAGFKKMWLARLVQDRGASPRRAF